MVRRGAGVRVEYGGGYAICRSMCLVVLCLDCSLAHDAWRHISANQPAASHRQSAQARCNETRYAQTNRARRRPSSDTVKVQPAAPAVAPDRAGRTPDASERRRTRATARRQNHHARPGAQQHLAADRRQFIRRRGRPPSPPCRRATTRRSTRSCCRPPDFRKIRSGRHAACSQRTRQHSISDQRHLSSGRRLRLRPGARQRPHRQYRRDRRCPSGRIRPAYGRHRRYHDQERGVRWRRQRQPLWRQPPDHHAELRIWRHGRRHRIFLHRPLFRQQRGIENPTPSVEPSTIIPTRANSSAMSRPCSATEGV